MTIAPDRVEFGRAMLLAGLRQHHAFDTVNADIPSQWARFKALPTIPGTVGAVRYGAICSASEAERQIEYMCAVEVSDFDAVPRRLGVEEIGRMRVPQARYAVFCHDGSVAELPRIWTAIWKDWAANNGKLQPAPTPDFERYGEKFDVARGTGDIEIWVPVIDV